MESVLLDAAGHRRSPATMPGYHRGRPLRNKGEEYPADPPTVEEIVAVMRAVGDRPDGHRLRALIVLLWRAGLRISEALALQESDLDSGRGAVLVRRGKGGKRREVGMDRWAWEQLDPWLEIRRELPIGALLCVITARPPADAGNPRPHASSGITRPPRRAFGAASRRTSCGTRTRSRWRTRASRWSSSNASSDTPNLGITQHLPAGHRQLRDHHDRPRTAPTDDLRHRRAPAEAIEGVRTGRPPPPGRPDAPPPAGDEQDAREALVYLLLCRLGHAVHRVMSRPSIWRTVPGTDHRAGLTGHRPAGQVDRPAPGRPPPALGSATDWARTLRLSSPPTKPAEK